MDYENERNIVEMITPNANTGFHALSQIEAYWEALRGTRLMPKRSEIDPRGIENVLEYTFVLERVAIGVARLRIAGSHLGDLMGMEVRGMPISTFISTDYRKQLSDVLEEVFQRPACCELRLRSEQARGKSVMDARMLLMPLKSDFGDVSRVLGCLVARGEIGRQPRRFDILGSKSRPLFHPLSDVPAPQNPKQSAAKAQSLITTPVDFEVTATHPKAPHLRLVKIN